MAASLNNSFNTPAWQEWITGLMGGVSLRSHAPTLPPDRFYCLLDELPLHLVPRYALESLRNRANERLFLNPNCVFCTGQSLPDELAGQEKLISGLALQGTVAWVRDPSSTSWLPFWLGPALEAIVRDLNPGEAAPDNLPVDALRLLSGAGILIPDGHDASCQRRWDDAVSKAGPLFRERGYGPLSNLLHPFQVAALRRYYRFLIRTGAIALGDGQSSLRYVAYNEPVARFFHRSLTPILSAVAGEELKPSYVYMASYKSGAELKKHTDREQCDFSITLCVDFSPEPEMETPWPIRLDASGGTATVYQALGDGLAYRGIQLPHYRDKLGEGRTSTSIFFHYVRADFAGSLD